MGDGAIGVNNILLHATGRSVSRMNIRVECTDSVDLSGVVVKGDIESEGKAVLVVLAGLKRPSGGFTVGK